MVSLDPLFLPKVFNSFFTGSPKIEPGSPWDPPWIPTGSPSFIHIPTLPLVSCSQIQIHKRHKGHAFDSIVKRQKGHTVDGIVLLSSATRFPCQAVWVQNHFALLVILASTENFAAWTSKNSFVLHGVKARKDRCRRGSKPRLGLSEKSGGRRSSGRGSPPRVWKTDSSQSVNDRRGCLVGSAWRS